MKLKIIEVEETMQISQSQLPNLCAHENHKMYNKLICDKDDIVFKLVDVPGDGNCFFHSVSLSPLLNVSDHGILCNILVERIEGILSNRGEQQDVLSLFHKISPHKKIFTWLENIKQNNVWGNDRAALFVAYIYEVNVRIISNFAKGFYYNDIRTISELNGYSIIPSDARTIHLYHFLFEKPFVASKNCNHFGFLQKVDIALELYSDNVYGAKTNIDEGYGDIVAGLKRKKQATLFEAYRVPKKMKKDDLKQLSKSDTKRQVKRYKDGHC